MSTGHMALKKTSHLLRGVTLKYKQTTQRYEEAVILSVKSIVVTFVVTELLPMNETDLIKIHQIGIFRTED